MKSLAKNSLFNALYQMLNMIFPLITSMYVARTLLPEGVGRVAYAQNIASYFVTAAALGIPTVGLRAVSIERNNKLKLNKVFSELVILNACSTLISLLLYLSLVFGNPAIKVDYPLYLAVGLVIAFNLINIDWFYQAHEEYVYIVIRSIVVKVLSLLGLFVFVTSKEDYVIYAVLTSFATCGNYIFNIVRVKRYVTFSFRDLNLLQHIKPVMFFAGTLFFAAIYGKVDTTMLGIIVGDESVGYYSYAHKILQIGVSFCASITSAFLPRLSYCYEHDKEQFYALIAKGLHIIAFLSIPAATGLFILAPEAIVLLFGAAFMPAAQTLRIFSGLIIVYAFGNLMCYQMMICSGSEKKHVVVLACAAVMNVILNLVLIPRFKHNGAAIASVVTEAFINIVESIYFAKLLKLKYNWTVMREALISSGIMGLSILFLKNIVHGSVFAFGCCIIIGVVVYVTVNIIFKNKLVTEGIILMRRKFL